jgi:hypothetical protein
LNVKNDKKLWWNTMKNERYSYKTRKRLSYKKEAFLGLTFNSLILETHKVWFL